MGLFRALFGSILFIPEAGVMLSRVCLCLSLHQQSPNWKTTFLCLIGFDLSSIPPSLPHQEASSAGARGVALWRWHQARTRTATRAGDMSSCQPAWQGRTCRCRHCPAHQEPHPPTPSADTSKQMVAKEIEHSQTCPGRSLAEEGQSRDPPAVSLNTFYDKKDITAAKSIGPALHKHHEADGLCLKPLLADLPAFGSQATIVMAANSPSGQCCQPFSDPTASAGSPAGFSPNFLPWVSLREKRAVTIPRAPHDMVVTVLELTLNHQSLCSGVTAEQLPPDPLTLRPQGGSVKSYTHQRPFNSVSWAKGKGTPCLSLSLSPLSRRHMLPQVVTASVETSCVLHSLL